MKKMLLKFWIEGVKGYTDSFGRHHHLTLKVAPEVEYFGLKIPFIHISSQFMSVKTDKGDTNLYQPVFNMYVKSYEIVEESSDKNWKDYIDLKVEEGTSNIKLSVSVKNVWAVQRDEHSGALCLDPPEITNEA